jgi:hypothetical protein
MKLVFASAALLGLSLAPAAYGQITCSEVNRLLSEAEYDFEDIEGAEIEDYYYKATYNISGANECTIDIEFDSVYSCEWQYYSQSDASAAMSSHIASLGYCLSGWSAPSSMSAQPSADSNGYRRIAGTFWEGKGDFIDLEWAVELEEHNDSSGTHYHLWVDLVYYYF